MPDRLRRTLCGALSLAPFAGISATLAATGFPARPIRVIVPYPGGDGTDVIARLLAHQMQARLKVPVVVENKVGAAGYVGAQAMANAPADGYTICLMTSGHITHQTLYKRYDLLQSATPITKVASAPYLFLVPPDSPLRSIQDALAAIRARPGQLSLGTGGMGSPAHMAWEMFSSAVPGLSVNHIPYKSGLESAQAVAARQVDLASTYIGSAYPLVKAGRVRALAATSKARLPQLPDVPTLSETVAPGYAFSTPLFFAAPARTPPDVVQVLFTAIQGAAHDPALLGTLDTLAHRLELSTSQAEFQTEIQSAIVAEVQLIRSRGIKASG